MSNEVRNTVVQTLRPKSTFSPDMTDELRTILLRPINGNRVGRDGKGFSHVQAYDIRAHLNRCFDFLGWSAETLKMELVFESSEDRTNKSGEIRTVWTVCYRAQVRLIVGVAVYTEWATGDSSSQPSRADAHDMALKTAESQALKRAAANLGDQFGLSLYAKGSTDALVKGVVGHLARQPEDKSLEPVDPTEHLTEPLPAEDEAPGWVDTPDEPDPRSKNTAPLIPPMSIEEIRARTAAIQDKR